ncbi:2OG-Fe(II) oxygenase family protein [Candidatus Pelagibacter sp.]|jgi:hypothetical protein|nr:2OG-Fe(II) oxygenase family protein [Candidatus Pelagibacter sp.]
MDKVKYQVVKNFGPSVFKIEMPEQIVEKLNAYVDKVIKDREKQESLNFGNKLVGDVTQEFFLEPETVRETGWLNFLSKSAQRWIEIETGKKISTFDLKSSWIVRQFQNEYNPTHWHNGHISGAGFLKVPKNLGEHKQKKSSAEYKGGNLQLIHGARMFLCNSVIDIKPKVGDFYFFPNYLMHTVFPFKDTNEERRSISFNASIDSDIYNVYKD